MRLAIALMFSAVLAGPAAGREGGTAACREDAERLCKGAPAGGMKACMLEHEAELNADCRAALSRLKAAPPARKEKAGKKDSEEPPMKKPYGEKPSYEACVADKERFCKDVEPGGGRILECLRAHEAELSEGCRKLKFSKPAKKEPPREAKSEKGNG